VLQFKHEYSTDLQEKNKERATLLARYFKPAKGIWGGDVFIGLTVPQVRAIKKYRFAAR
jgi:hypothetical protein